MLPLAAAAGLDPDKVASIVTTGSARSFASDRFVPRMLKGSFEGDYSLTGAYKDIVNLRQLCVDEKLAGLDGADGARIVAALYQKYGDGRFVDALDGAVGEVEPARAVKALHDRRLAFSGCGEIQLERADAQKPVMLEKIH